MPLCACTVDTVGCPHTRTPPNSAIKRLRLPARLPASPEHAKHVFMSQALILAGKLASGGAVCGWMAFLHPFWQEKGAFPKLHQTSSAPGFKLLLCQQMMLQCQILPGGCGGACWWVGLIAMVCMPMQGVASLRPRCKLSPPDLAQSCGTRVCVFQNL